jgi:hypothetical protein
MPISDKAWSSFTEADYTPAQWHEACLVHLHEPGKMTSKNECKLPVREPDGTLNRNAVHSAAAALAGARGGMKGVSAEEKKAAARKLAGLYREMKETAPESMYRMAGMKAPMGK